MGILSRLLKPRAAVDINDERLWTSWTSSISAAGVPVNATSAMTSSAVWACVRLIAESMATMPLIVYRNLPSGGRERATNHPIYSLLHDQPNRWQTAFEWIEMMTGHALLRGNAYSQIIPGPRGPVDTLIPIHPDRVTVEQLDNGVIRYRVRNNGKPDSILNDEDVMHIRGLSDDGVMGMSVISYAANSMGMTLAAEQYGSRFFRNDSRPGGVLKHPGKVKDPQRIKESWQDLHSGENQHSVAVLEEGMEWQQIGINPNEAQFLETREFQVADIARWFRVPLHMIQEVSGSTSWGTGIEQQQLGFVMFTLLPWARRWEQALSRDLILATQTYYAEFLIDSLVRGDIKSRYDAYAVGRNWGWLSVNDVRRLENLNPIDSGDQYLVPLNMAPAGQNAQIPAAAAAAVPDPHYRLLLTEAAGRIVRKEGAAMKRAARRCGDDREHWGDAVAAFYAAHEGFVAQTLGIEAGAAQQYAEGRQTCMTNIGPDEVWIDELCGAEYVQELVAYAERNTHEIV